MLSQIPILDLFTSSNPGLFHGNTAIGLYLGLTNRTLAKSIITKEIHGLKSLSNDLSLEDSIIGVVPFINILATRQFRQPLTALLEEVDSIIYKQAGYLNHKLDILQSTHLSLYLSYRLSMTEQTPIHKSLWLSISSSLTETILNSFSTIVSRSNCFSLYYSQAFYLSCFLLSLKSGLDHNIFRKKFVAILPNVLECFPNSSANKLYLLLVLQNISNELQLNNINLNKHIKLLSTCISLNDIEEELKNKIYVGDGLCGLYMICHYLKSDYSFLNRLSKYISKQIETSNEIRRLYNNSSYLSNHIGLWNGIGGILLTSLLIRLNNIRNEFNK